MEGVDFNRWRAHCEHTRRVNSARAQALTTEFRVDMAWLFVIVGAAFAILMVGMSNIAIGPRSLVETPVPMVSIHQPEEIVIPPISTPVENGAAISRVVQSDIVAEHRSFEAGEVSIVVQEGDTLWDLVGTEWPAVCRVNTLTDCNLIFPGQTLRVPAKRQE